MNNLIPYISSEPPPIDNDNIEIESYNTEIFSPYQIIGNSNVESESMDTYYVEPNVNTIEEIFPYQNYGRDNSLSGTRNPVELYEYIESIVDNNNLRIDCTDSAINNHEEDDMDYISERSYDGQFDNCSKTSVTLEDCSKCSPISNEVSDKIKFASEICEELIEKCIKLKVQDPTDLMPIQPESTAQANYFVGKDEDGVSTNREEESLDFADFSFVNYTPEVINDLKSVSTDQIKATVDESDLNFDDDFEDFASFEDTASFFNPEPTQRPEDSLESSDQCLKNLLQSLSVNLGPTHPDFIDLQNNNNISPLNHRPGALIFNQKLFDDVGLVLWKELTNYDFSPAFIFQWMQSATYERFMTSIGPEYKELLSSHRATLPLYSVNLTPIEPIAVENCLPINASASSSSFDAISRDESGINVVGERNSNIDFKDLEEEFIFNQFSNTLDTGSRDASSLNSSPLSSISSTVVQSERFGGLFKSILKPLNAAAATTKTSAGKPTNPQTEAILKELPDLSYMSSKVLMFPVISSCDVEDNI